MVHYNHLRSELKKVEDILERETDPDRILKISMIYLTMQWSATYDDPIDIEGILNHKITKDEEVTIVTEENVVDNDTV
jgi:hypothetical protein